MTVPYVGQGLKRVEDVRFISGKGRYVDDIPPAGALHCAILRSPHAHARIVRVDASRARTMDGVPPLVEAGITDFRVYAVPADPSAARDQLSELVTAFRGTVGRS